MYGVASLIFWALMVVVSIKYAGFIMRAHNRGDGGIMALTALLQRNRVPHGALLVTLGIFGAALFFGDGVITPAISVLGSIQGVQVATPALAHLVVPLSVAILLGLFVLQRFGSGTIGWLFGPVILVWFTAIGIARPQRGRQGPGRPPGSVPDLGGAVHGRPRRRRLSRARRCGPGRDRRRGPVRRPGPFRREPDPPGLVRRRVPGADAQLPRPGGVHPAPPGPGARHEQFNPFYQMAPRWALWPLVVLAAFATVIASQAAISGSFSVAKQAVQLGFLPRLKVLHTSKIEGQIYVPVINWGLCIGVVALTLVFRSATKLGDIYGVAVTGTFILNTILFLAVARFLWGTAKRKLAPVAILFLTVEVAFFSSNIAKVEHGAWLPLAVGLVISIVMINWRRGQVIVTRNRVAQEGPLDEFLDGLAAKQTAAHPHPDRRGVPVPRQGHYPAGAPRRGRAHQHAPERVVIVSVDTVSIPHVETFDRCAVEVIGHGLFKVVHLTARFGYHDKLNIPEALALARKQGLLERNLDLEHASYFVSRITITPTDAPGMRRWRKKLFIAHGPQRVQRDRSLRATRRSHRDHGLSGRALTNLKTERQTQETGIE